MRVALRQRLSKARGPRGNAPSATGAAAARRRLRRRPQGRTAARAGRCAQARAPSRAQTRRRRARRRRRSGDCREARAARLRQRSAWRAAAHGAHGDMQRGSAARACERRQQATLEELRSPRAAAPASREHCRSARKPNATKQYATKRNVKGREVCMGVVSFRTTVFLARVARFKATRSFCPAHSAAACAAGWPAPAR